MKILYDGQVYRMQTAGGISRYFNNLITRLPEDFSPTMTSCVSKKKNLPVHPNLKNWYYQIFRPGRLSYWIEKHYFRVINQLEKFDIAHPTYYSLLTRKEIKDYEYPVVVTVWDMIHEIFFEQMDSSGQYAQEKQKAVKAADAIICISENTKNDLLNRYSTDESKVTVTYLASQIDASLAFGSEPVPEKPYYLYVGSRACYKNFDGLLSAFAKAVSVKPEIVLCVVGLPFDKTEEKKIAELNLSHRIYHYGQVSDYHLAKLYRCSIAFVYPSLYEGFGIPPLEAMSCGTPVIACNCSSIPEVVGDAGLLFNPKEIGELADMLIMLLESPGERDRLIEKGHQRTKIFSWDKTTAQTIDVYRSVSK
ncbi:glycosyltransferase family 4 protein [Roseofilum capinflatum]|uniref:Glycosyltransferase family 1 protein n=1 Tax=Roseofilum capinflatum BLCC-M114 TaxID=3022440 RepID=A0ABT7B8A6_9CYAN|nr:glycosyltransferase family 1 protein [Roseofilum capinflatum]MDJ1175409.1 glycosyltransferase family 1 protein [Roseofilum capinflatum BLCC-M114]